MLFISYRRLPASQYQLAAIDLGKPGGTLVYSLAAGGFYNPAMDSYGPSNVQEFNSNDITRPSMTISGVKGDGKMYVLLINKKHNHRPESISSIDFKRAIVLDIYEHINVAQIGNFFNYTSKRPKLPDFPIGSSEDNNLPQPTPISDLKAWESGSYYLGVVFWNTTYHLGTSMYLEIPVNMEASTQ